MGAPASDQREPHLRTVGVMPAGSEEDVSRDIGHVFEGSASGRVFLLVAPL